MNNFWNNLKKPILIQAPMEDVTDTVYGIDINMGCPEKSVIKKGSCADLISNHKLAKCQRR